MKNQIRWARRAASALAFLCAGAAAQTAPSASCVALWKSTEQGQKSPGELWASCSSQRDERGAGLRLKAARAGRWEWLKSWGGVTPEALSDADAQGDGLLHAAAQSEGAGGGGLAREWIAAGGSLDVKNKAGQTPLLAALVSGGAGGDEMALALLRAGANPFKAGPSGETALHYIASARGPEQALWLGAKADVNRRSASGVAPLEVAIANDNGPMTKWLVERKAPLTDPVRGPLVYLAAGKPSALAAFLSAAPAEAKRRGQGGQTLLHAAVMADEPAKRTGMEAGGKKEKKSEKTPAVLSESSALGILLAAGLDPNGKDDRGITPVMLAVAQGKALALERLLKAGADLCAVDKDGFPAWRMANSAAVSERLKNFGRCR